MHTHTYVRTEAHMYANAHTHVHEQTRRDAAPITNGQPPLTKLQKAKKTSEEKYIKQISGNLTRESIR